MASTRKLIVSNKNPKKTLVEEMDENPDAAREFRQFGQTKQTQDSFWERLSTELNSLGPPIRIRQDWQWVWTNYKANLRRKMAQNRQNVQATGGGPSQELPLTALEETVAAILNTRIAVNPRGRVFGVTVDGDGAATLPL